MPIIDHFGLIARWYDRIIPAREPEKLMSLIGLPVSGPLLDAGGGTGRIAQFFREGASPVVVADLSFEMLRQAANKGGLRRVCSHTESLPFPDQIFERIVMVDALHHVCDQVETAGELWRVLKPGGRIIIEEPDLRTLPVKLVAVAEKLALMRSHFLSPPSIATLFSYPNAHTWISQDGFNAWVIIEKRNG